MNKSELVDALAKETRFTKVDLEESIDAMLRIIQAQVAAGNDVTLSGFGTFTLMTRKARKGYNPHTGTELQLPAFVLPKFRPGKNFRETVERKKPL